MAMSTGGKGGSMSEINMTPMIDVLLVLLIIFLVIQPALQKGIEVQVPPVEESPGSDQPQDQIILTVGPGPTYTINEIPVPTAELEARIRGIFQDRPRKVLFVRGDPSVTYGQVVDAIDDARGGGIEVVGLVPGEPPPGGE